MTSLREKLKAVTDMQSPINGPGIERLNELLTAIVDEIEEFRNEQTQGK